MLPDPQPELQKGRCGHLRQPGGAAQRQLLQLAMGGLGPKISSSFLHCLKETIKEKENKEKEEEEQEEEEPAGQKLHRYYHVGIYVTGGSHLSDSFQPFFSFAPGPKKNVTDA